MSDQEIELHNQLLEAGLRLAEDNEPGAFWLFVRVAGEVLAVWVIEETAEPVYVAGSTTRKAGPDYTYGSTIRESVGLGAGVDY